ncbi:MAG: ActS/PrrB/RegB family redox-sensitive histidine kinase [Neomegalonema sp.]|nr:ActS/PrrB/RegB family redox-sensitive histidine kinase [Neomegalonema sp.]
MAHLGQNKASEAPAGDQSDFARAHPGAGVRPPRQNTLATLRWAALLGQSAAVAVAATVLDIRLPLGPCVLAILAGAAFNLATNTYRGGPRRRLSEMDAFLALLFDLSQLVALLYLTGGLANPFAVFLLAPVTISALTLSIRPTMILGVICVAAASLLAFHRIPLESTSGAPPDDSLLIIGFWTAIALSAVFQAVYARRIAADNHAMTSALAATQMALEREQRLSAIGAMAAAAAHELGTPLATIKLAAGELRSELQESQELAEDAALIAEQAERCREILARLSALREEPRDQELEWAPMTAVIDEAAAPHRGRGARILVRLEGLPIDMDAPGGPRPRPQPSVSRRAEIIHGLRNLIQNAVDFAASTVWVDVASTPEGVTVEIGDDGPGFSADILAKLGEPYATTRARPLEIDDDAQGYFGMGLGVFISKTLLERTGAQLEFLNAAQAEASRPVVVDPATTKTRSDGPTGAIVRVYWPASAG